MLEMVYDLGLEFKSLLLDFLIVNCRELYGVIIPNILEHFHICRGNILQLASKGCRILSLLS